MRYRGNRVCCGTYACLNAMDNPRIDPLLFEISMGAPFGVAHVRNPYFDRLLTTYRDPNWGMDRAAGLWGYESLHFASGDKRELIDFIRSHVAGSAVVVGPIDMGRLWYLPLSNLYHRLDHYITLFYSSPSDVCLVDSEGVPACRADYEILSEALSIDGIPEAGERYHARVFRKEKDYNRGEIVGEAMRQASRNLNGAFREGQGPRAYSDCLNTVEHNPTYRWKNSLLFDISYLLQRKELHEYLLENGEREYPETKTRAREIGEILNAQKKALRSLFLGIESGEDVEALAGLFKQLEALEEEIS